ncbi:MAG: LysE family transporter [Muribaculaceae bacterium]|nr:LysE family transporter [Muribaculaceae bacterium]
MVHFADIFISGFIIGILISAPMGPIGMLCIQRTLNKGRWPAFFTGVGAALSDLLYCLLTGLGLALITDFIEENRNLLQFLGSLVLIVFGIFLFRKNPASALKKPSDKGNTFWFDFLTGFLFTFSNPLILFFIIGLFTQFDFLKPEFMFYHYILGYIAIFCGAIVWWYGITFFVNKVRNHINVRSLWLINRIIGSLLILMALGGIFISIKGWL